MNQWIHNRLAFNGLTTLEHVWGFWVGLSLRGFFVDVRYVVLNQGCCGTCQYNLPDLMLWHNFNATLNQNYVIPITLVSITYPGRGSVSPIYSFLDSGPWKVLYVPLFLTVFVRYLFLTFLVSVCDVNKKNISRRVYLTNFLISQFCLFLFFLFSFFESMLFCL